MVEISKYDKKVWENYVSNLENSILIPKNDILTNTNQNNTRNIFKNKTFNRPKNFKENKLDQHVSLDLHGYTLYSAKVSLHKFLSNCYEKNVRNILIITGKGQNNSGALKKEVPKWLTDKFLNKHIVSFSFAPRHLGGEGALLVRIKNKYKKFNY